MAWPVASGTVTRYEIGRETLSKNRWSAITVVGTVAGTVTSLVDKPAKGTYRYSVRAVTQVLGTTSTVASAWTGPSQEVTVSGAPGGGGKK